MRPSTLLVSMTAVSTTAMALLSGCGGADGADDGTASAPVTFLSPPMRGFLVPRPGMTDCPCR